MNPLQNKWDSRRIEHRFYTEIKVKQPPLKYHYSYILGYHLAGKIKEK